LVNDYKSTKRKGEINQMPLKIYDVNVEIQSEDDIRNNPIFTAFEISQGDLNTIQVNLHIKQNDNPLNLTGYTVRMAIKKPSGLTVFQDCIVTDAVMGDAEIVLTNQSYIEYGFHVAEIYINSVDEIAVSQPFHYSVKENIMNDESIESTTEWTALQLLFNEFDKRPILTNGFPTIVPEYIGQMVFDQLNRIVYISNDVTSTSWQTIGGGGGGEGGNDDILGTGSPTITPVRIGQVYIDIQNETAFIATGSTSADWEQIDGGGVDLTNYYTKAEIDEKLPSPTVTPYRYVREWLNGNNYNTQNAWNEIQIYVAGTNIAPGKTITASSIPTPATNWAWLMDGNTTISAISKNIGNQWVEIDLGAEYVLETIKTFHKIQGTNTYYDVTLEVSRDGINYYTVYKTSVNGTYYETTSGKEYTPTPLSTAYVSRTEYNHDIEKVNEEINWLYDNKAPYPIVWADITDKPTTFTPTTHTHVYNTLTGIPTTFTPSAHNQDWTTITGKPATYPPDSHVHAYNTLTGIPTTFTPAAHTQDWTTITGKPTITQPPLSGTTDPGLTPNYIGQIYINTTTSEAWVATTSAGGWQTISMDELGGGAGSVDWTAVTNKPTTFTPSTHGHLATEITEDTTHRFMTDAERTKLGGIAAGATNYTHPATHPATMITEDTTHRFTTDAEKTTWNNKAPTTAVTTTTNGLMIAADKLKLDGIAANANNYTHPATHPATMITEDTTHRFVTDTEKTTWNGKASTAIVTTSTNGLMIASDKTKLDGIAAGATNYTHPATHPATMITEDATRRFVSDTEKTTWNNKASTAVVTTTTNGLMIATDKTKLDGLTNYTHPASHPATMITEDTTHRFVTDTEKSTWNEKLDATTANTNYAVKATETQTATNTTALNGLKLWSGTQAAYDGLTKDPNTIYFIV
jgi:hypothetical protein